MVLIDAHTTQACSLVAFGDSYGLVRDNIARTSCATCSNNIASYALYWVLSVVDYFFYSGDEPTVAAYGANVDGRLRFAASIANTSFDLHFFGSDDRVGADFEYPSAPESQRAYTMLAIQCMRAWLRVLQHCKSCDASNATVYEQLAASLTARARAPGPQWHAAYGLHAAAGAVLAGIVTDAEAAVLYAREFASPIQICSFSPFNM